MFEFPDDELENCSKLWGAFYTFIQINFEAFTFF